MFHGQHSPLNKVYPKSRRNIGAITSSTKKENTSTSNILNWEEKHTKTFSIIKKQISKINENNHFDVEKETRVKCDASKLGLGVSLEQKTNNIWRTIAFACTFLNLVEQRYSTNDLELLAVVWLLEHFKDYLQGTEFRLQTDHQALLTALKENRGSKTDQSSLTRWVDRLLPFNFNIGHIPEKNWDLLIISVEIQKEQQLHHQGKIHIS